jgi:dephospho-CoA kinase
MMRRVIGIIGPVGAGKDILGKYLSQKIGLPCYPISSIVKEVASSQGLSLDRDSLILLGNKIAQEEGPDALAKILFSRTSGDIIVTGMRQHAQIDFFEKQARLTLIAIDADAHVRFERVQLRGSAGEWGTIEEFLHKEQLENSGKNIQRVFECMQRAQYRVKNESSLDDFYAQADKIIEDL